MNPGDMVEVRGHPPRVRSVLRDGIAQVKVDGKWKVVEPVWRPAIYAGWFGLGHTFRWTDNRHFVDIPNARLSTLVRKPQGPTQSQEKYIRGFGELC